jgi:microcompartment protein CcmK/EutM
VHAAQKDVKLRVELSVTADRQQRGEQQASDEGAAIHCGNGSREQVIMAGSSADEAADSH